MLRHNYTIDSSSCNGPFEVMTLAERFTVKDVETLVERALADGDKSLEQPAALSSDSNLDLFNGGTTQAAVASS